MDNISGSLVMCNYFSTSTLDEYLTGVVKLEGYEDFTVEELDILNDNFEKFKNNKCKDYTEDRADKMARMIERRKLRKTQREVYDEFDGFQKCVQCILYSYNTRTIRCFYGECLYTVPINLAPWAVILGNDGLFYKSVDLDGYGVRFVYAGALGDYEYNAAVECTRKISEQVNRVQTEDFK